MTGRNRTGSARATFDRRTLIAGAAVLVGGAAGAVSSPAATGMPTPAEVFADPDIPVLGNPGGDVTIVEFFDYQCPFCKKAHPVLDEAVRTDGQVRLVLKDWPIFGDVSVEASRLVLGAAGTPDYARGLEALMATPARLQLVEVDAALRDAGLDPEAMAAAYQRRSTFVDGILARNAAQADGFGLSGTPAFVIGTRVYGGVLDAAGFAQAIAEVRAAAIGKN